MQGEGGVGDRRGGVGDREGEEYAGRGRSGVQYIGK
jgi:hypothetical protein